MHILYLSWDENCKIDMLDTMSRLNYTVSLITAPLSNYLNNPDVYHIIYNAILESHCDAIFSFNYLPVVSQAAEQAKTPYLSWVYDCPHWTLFSPDIANPYNHIFLFDYNMVIQAQENGAVHAYHLPLAVNVHRLNSLLTHPCHSNDDISFVGTLYENNMFRQIQYLPDLLHGYIDGILAAQKQIWGENILSALMTPDFIRELDTYIKYSNDSRYAIPKSYFFLTMLQTELTCRERIEYLNMLSKPYSVSLYSASAPVLCPLVHHKGILNYTTEMPFIFAHSKINLNFSLRSITSGIPLRALDIMGCGGFLLTNYQPELNEYFTNGVDYVYFESQEDLLTKTEYYMTHPKERTEIAANGLLKTTNNFSYEHQLQKMFSFL